MDIRLLRYFVAVVDHRGLRRAADEMHVAPSALSRAMRQLERDMGVELLHRSTDGMLPSAAGRDLLEHARSLLAAADDATAAMRVHARRGATLRVGLIGGPLVASELTLPILSDFRAGHPDTLSETAATSFDRQLDPLLDGELDVALVRGPARHPNVDTINIAYEPRVLLVGADHDLAGGTEVDIDDVLDEPTVTLAAAPEWAAFWQLDDLRGKPNPLRGLAPVRSAREMQRAVAKGAVISTSGAVHRLTPTDTTCALHLRGAEASTIAVARRRGDHRAAVDRFIEQAVHTAQRRIALIPGGTIA